MLHEEAARLWHDDTESHVVGGPNVAKELRAAIAAWNVQGISIRFTPARAGRILRFRSE